MTYRPASIGMVDDDYAVEAIAVALGEGPLVAEFNPLVDGGDTWDGMAMLLRWTHPSGAVLHIVVSARACTPAAVAMCGIGHGDLVRVEGSATQLLWPGVLGEVVLIDQPRDIEVVRHTGQASQQQSNSAPRSAA